MYPFFGSSQDGVAEARKCLEVILTRVKVKGVQRILPLRVDHLTWVDNWTSGTGGSRVLALRKAFEHDLGLSKRHIKTYYMGCDVDGKYWKLGWSCFDIALTHFIWFEY